MASVVKDGNNDYAWAGWNSNLGWKQICKAHKCINESPKNWKIERKSKRIIVFSVYSLNYGHSALYSLCVELNQN